MQASEIRQRFLRYFERQGHAIRPVARSFPGTTRRCFSPTREWCSSSVSSWAGATPDFGRRATTSQKCVRAGGKHNDLEQVGHTARHHTFFEMLGNFSFGDYFKRDAIRFAWEFLADDCSSIPGICVLLFSRRTMKRGRSGVSHRAPDSRIYGLGAHGQLLADGGHRAVRSLLGDLRRPRPCGRGLEFPEGARRRMDRSEREEFSSDAFVEGAEAGRFLEIWNLVFMQFDRQEDGTLVPLPKPSVDTGMGLERVAAVKQGVTNNYHTDLFAPLIERAATIVASISRPRLARPVLVRPWPLARLRREALGCGEGKSRPRRPGLVSRDRRSRPSRRVSSR